MSVTYRPASAVQRIAEKVIANHHTELTDVRIDYVFRSEAAKTAGKTIMGKARKVSGLNAYLASEVDEAGMESGEEDFFVVEIAEDIWVNLELRQREALVDHELCHCTTTFDKDGNLKLKLLTHDLEEFRAVVERHGLWQPDLEHFAEAMSFVQPSLDGAVRGLTDAIGPDGTMTITHDGESVTVPGTKGT